MTINYTPLPGAPVMKYVLLSFTFFFALVATNGCNEEETPTKPGPTEPDTTSHDFVWDVTQIGVRHTALHDVEAISENDVWICGEIHFEDTGELDSLGKMIKPYNLAHWNGMEWNFMRVKWPSDSPSALRAIFAIKAFAKDDIWFSTGAVLAHWNGEEFTYWEIRESTIPGFMPLMEGTPGHLYLAGQKGAMMHFDGKKHFTPVSTNTNKNIQDIWTDGTSIMAVCSNGVWGPAYETLILKIQDQKVTHWYDTLMYEGMSGIWFSDTSNVFLCGPGFRTYKDSKWNVTTTPYNGYLTSVRGLAPNDVFVAGHYGALQHFNGKTWRYFSEVTPLDMEYVLMRLSYIDGHVYAIGFDKAGRYSVFHGRRVRP